MDHGATAPAYGLWTLVIINSAIFILFAFSFFKPKTKRDWRTLGRARELTHLKLSQPSRRSTSFFSSRRSSCAARRSTLFSFWLCSYAWLRSSCCSCIQR